MSVRLFSIIGDANVRRNMTGLNVASREVMKSAQIIDYLGVTPIEQALSEVRDESSVCIVAAITDLLLSGGDCGTIFASIDPQLNTFFSAVSIFSQARPAVQVFLFILSRPCLLRFLALFKYVCWLVLCCSRICPLVTCHTT